MTSTRVLNISATIFPPGEEKSKTTLTISHVTQTANDQGPLSVTVEGQEIIIPPTVSVPFVPVTPSVSGAGLKNLAGTSSPSTSLPTPTSTSPPTASSPSRNTFPMSSSSRSSTSTPTGEAITNPGSSSQTPSEATARRNSDANSISPGAAAGIGIACAVAGALIAAAIVALLFRRRRRRNPTRSDAFPLHFASVDKTAVSSHDLSSPAGVIERNLPQPAEDQALGGELSRLGTLIKNHVQSYYHTNSVIGSVDQAALGIIAAGNMPLIASTLGSLLSNQATRLTAIRFCIAWVAISRIDPSCEPSRSFLPPEIAGCLVSIAGAREDSSTRMAFLSRWRVITASLLQSKYGGGNFGSYDPRNRNLSEVLQALDTVLSPFAAEKGDERARTQNLEEILRRGARFGFLLFSQPSTWELDWNAPPNAGRGVLAIMPSLVQIGDDTGRRLPRPRTVEEQELARGLESYL